MRTTNITDAIDAAIAQLVAMRATSAVKLDGIDLPKSGDALRSLVQSSDGVITAIDSLFSAISAQADVSNNYDDGLICDTIADGLCGPLLRKAEEADDEASLTPHQLAARARQDARAD